VAAIETNVEIVYDNPRLCGPR